MGYYLLSANLTRNADDIRADTMGIFATPQVGRRMGEMDDKVSDGTFLWGHVVLRGIISLCNSLIISVVILQNTST